MLFKWTRAHLVHGTYRLVGKVSIGDVPRGEDHTRVNGFRRGHAVVPRTCPDVVQDLNGFIDGCGLDQHLGSGAQALRPFQCAGGIRPR